MTIKNRMMLLGLVGLILLSLSGCADEDPAAPSDTTAPAAVTDLRVESVVGGVVTLAWTAPGDDGDTGTASSYDIRYADASVTEGNWGTCTQVSAAEPDPAAPGTEQSTAIDVGGDTNLYFALKTSDEASNWSSLSNVVVARLGGGFIVHQLTSEGSNDHPCVDNGYVVWIHFNVEDEDEIYIANLESAFPALTRLTDNGGEKEHPNNHGSERIVWEGRMTYLGGWEIWLYNKYTTPRFAQFTDNDVTDRYADLSSAGSFAWLQGNTMFEEVHYWYEPGHSESVISNDCCPTSNWSNEIPSADDGAVVWRSYDRVGSEGFKVLLWDGALTDITDDIEGHMTYRHSLYAGTIAYEYGGGGSTVIKYCLLYTSPSPRDKF